MLMQMLPYKFLLLNTKSTNYLYSLQDFSFIKVLVLHNPYKEKQVLSVLGGDQFYPPPHPPSPSFNMTTSVVSLKQGNVKKSRKLIKTVKAGEKNLHIF